MAITATSVATTDTLEKLRQEYNNLRTDVNGIDSGILNLSTWIFEGATADDFETTIGVVDPTADRTINFPNESGTVMLSGAATSAFTNITVADDGNIGSTSDPDAIAISAAGVVTMSQDLIITGDFTVNGTTTTVNSTNTTLDDNLLELNSGAGSNANDCGIIIERGSTGDNAIIAWDESVDKFTVGTTTATASDTGNLTITAGTLVANLEGTVATAAQASITSLGNLTALAITDGAYIGSATTAQAIQISQEGYTRVAQRYVNANAAATYVLVEEDAGKIVTSTNAAAQTITIPANSSVAYVVGTQIDFYQLGSTTLSIKGDTGVTLNGVSAGTGAINGQYKAASIFKIDTDTWAMAGDHGTVA